MEELEGCATMISWDWDTDDIDANEDDGKQWAPMIPQMMKSAKTPWPVRVGLPMLPVMPPQKMTMYAL